MAFTTGIFGNCTTACLHLNRFVKLIGSKCERMKESVLSFGKIFGNQSSGRVAIVTSGDGAMAGLNETVEMILHDVAVSAGFRVVSKIRGALAVNEGVTSEACRCADSESDPCSEDDAHLGRRSDCSDW